MLLGQIVAACPVLEEVVFDMEGLTCSGSLLSSPITRRYVENLFKASLNHSIKRRRRKVKGGKWAVNTAKGIDGLRSTTDKEWLCIPKGEKSSSR